MKKADIEKQLAEHPETVFRCGGRHYQIKGIVQEEGWRTNSRTWRVQPVYFGFNSETNTLNVGKETSFTMPLSKVDWIAFNNLEELEKFLIEERVRIEKEKTEEKMRQEKFTVLSKEINQLLVEVGMSKNVWIDNTFQGSERVNMRMGMEDLEKLATILQTSIKTGEK
jgi:hypothetical protein